MASGSGKPRWLVSKKDGYIYVYHPVLATRADMIIVNEHEDVQKVVAAIQAVGASDTVALLQAAQKLNDFEQKKEEEHPQEKILESISKLPEAPAAEKKSRNRVSWDTDNPDAFKVKGKPKKEGK